MRVADRLYTSCDRLADRLVRAGSAERALQFTYGMR